ncbi:beta-ketoacyl-[acyl-carrier-protein] synthase family protein [uncultured Shewanella sp.]|uniref:beta-ketoacyl-[acyl-carrier-protein] synthase family protein n=1 Tax=uncultured Shewanella sp. TaxID=173975 RepID=UPI0026156D0C|nr:beta-ketoacyl-[acyl-carrier-protein] synthase family protein [uncultured Shewanella sp.]
MTKIAITQLGLCTPLGQTKETVLAHLLNGKSGLKPQSGLLFDRSAMVGKVTCVLPTIPTPLSDYNTRNNQILLCAAKQIESAVHLAKKHYGQDRVGVVLGTSTSGIESGEQALKFYQKQHAFPENYDYALQELGNTSEFLQAYFSLTGPCYTLSTACSSSAKVFASARRLLMADLCDMVIVGGSDSLCQLTLNGFDALESISDKLCQPFSANRQGINIGEGAALFTLEKNTSVHSSGAQIQLAGVGESSDAHHISAPQPEGRGAIAAMQAAIKDANIQASQISYVNLHGTATQKNDAMESRAIQAVFQPVIPPVSSTKPLTGHTLGAAGAIEAAFCYLLLSDENSHAQLPPHLWDKHIDSDNPALPFVERNELTHHKQKLRYIMSNSFAFGGSNASLIFSREDDNAGEKNAGEDSARKDNARKKRTNHD